MENKNLIEARAREVETKRERVLKKYLMALLRDDKRGHKHAKYAERLEDFILKIVDRNKDPKMTAAVSFEEQAIYISDGFLIGGIWKDDKKEQYSDSFYQLNVLMRHELAHYLMQHQIRMMDKIIAKYGKDGGTRISMSQSLHHLINIIEDFEISNTRYTAADKIVVKNMVLAGREIGGLVTENIRNGWEKLTVLQMFDKLTEEIEGLQQGILASWQALDLNKIGDEEDYMHHNIKNTAALYIDTKAQTNFMGSVEKFVKDQALYHFWPFDRMENGRPVLCIVKCSSLPDEFQNVIKDIFNAITAGYEDANGNTLYYTKQMARDYLDTVAKSHVLQTVSLTAPNAHKEFVTLYTPEEKLLATDTLKALIPTLELRKTWYDKVMRVMGDDSKYSIDDLESVLAALEK
jgi:hypothetical protein